MRRPRVRSSAHRRRRCTMPIVAARSPWIVARVRVRMPTPTATALAPVARRCRAAQPDRAGGAVPVDPEHGLGQPPLRRRRRARRPAQTTKTPQHRLTARSPSAATRIAAFGVADGSNSDLFEPLPAHVSASSRRRGHRRRAVAGAARCRRAGARGPRPRAARGGRPGRLAPRVAARSETFQLVGVLRGDRLVIYLDRSATNEPVTTADIAVTIGDAADAVNAEWAAEGTYTLTSPQFRTAGTDRAGVLDHRRRRRGSARGDADGAARGRRDAGRFHDRHAAHLADVAGLADVADGAAGARDRRRSRCTAPISCCGAISCRRRRLR